MFEKLKRSISNYFGARIVYQPAHIYSQWNIASTGEPVTPEQAEKIPAVQACIQTISQDISGMPVRICQATEKGMQRLRWHPLDDILNQRFNGLMSAVIGRQMQLRHMCLYGRSISYVERNDKDEVTAIYPYHPSETEQVITQQGLVFYNIMTLTGKRAVRQADILHSIYQTSDGVNSQSIIELACDAIGIAIASDTFAASYLANGTHASGHIEHPGKLSTEAARALSEDWVEKFAGFKAAGKTPTLTEGAQFKPNTPNGDSMQLLQSRKWQFEEICRVFKVSPVMVGELGKSSYSTYTAVQQSHVQTCLLPWISRLEQEWTYKLLTPWERKQGMYIEIDPSGLLRGDQEAQDRSFALGIDKGWYSVNDVRQYKNLPPLEEAVIDTEIIDSTAIKLEPQKLVEETVPEPVENRSLEPILIDVISRVITKEINAIKRAAKSEQDLVEWANNWYANHKNLVYQAILPCYQVENPEEADRLAQEFADTHCKESIQDIADAIQFDALEDLYNQWRGRRLQRIKL